MAHVRQQVRQAIIAALSGLPTTGSRVYASRVRQLGDALLPALSVSTERETIEQAQTTGERGSRLLSRAIAARIDGYAAVISSVEDTLDTIASEVEGAMAADPTLGGMAKDSWLEETSVELDGEGEDLVGHIALEYRVLVRTVETDPGTAVQ